ncbi:50S ribosomal protein L21 [candidate division WOR-3 bacterium]|nr:50S ribosomal protein L21 [candidate division WOR-3 bacterium]
MNAVVEIAGFQYRVSKHKIFNVPKLDAKEGEVIRISTVLAVSNDNDVKVGNPFLDNAYVDAKVLKFGKDPKILVYKYKKRKKYRRMKGHRQDYTQIEIVDIGIKEKVIEKKKEPKKTKETKETKSTKPTKQTKSTKKTKETKPIKSTKQTK